MATIRTYIGYAIGTNMGDADRELEVMVPDFAPTAEGVVDNEYVPDTIDVDVTNTVIGGKSRASVTISETIKCTYFGGRSNISIPNIYRGEHVLVHNMGNDVFYWEELGRDDAIRTTEHLVLHVANKHRPDTTDALTPATMYTISMDTREGKRGIRIHTSAGTDEPVTYDINIDTDKSIVETIDSLGNGQRLASNPNGVSTWHTWNKEGSSVILEGTNITVNGPDTHTTNSPTVTVNCHVTTVNAGSSVSINTPVTNISGDVAIGGSLAVACAGGSGTARFAGKIIGDADIAMAGNIAISGNLSAGGDGAYGGNVTAANL